MPFGDLEPNGGGASGNSGENEFDWGDTINEIGGLVNQLFDGNFWQSLMQLGCLSSTYKLSYLKDRFPNGIEKMRQLSGVSYSMTDENVNHFVRRLYQKLKQTEKDKNGSSCKHTYYKKENQMFQTYINELDSILISSGYVVDGVQNVSGLSNKDIYTNWGWDIEMNFECPKYKKNLSSGGGSYDYIGGEFDEGGGYYSYTPTLTKISASNIVLGLSVAYMVWKMMSDNKNFKKKIKF